MDRQTAEEYAANLQENLQSLLDCADEMFKNHDAFCAMRDEMFKVQDAIAGMLDKAASIRAFAPIALAGHAPIMTWQEKKSPLLIMSVMLARAFGRFHGRL